MAKSKSAAPELPPGVPEAHSGTNPPEGLKPPPFGAPKVIDPAGELPRVCDQLDRVPAGSKAKRFKCRVDNYDGFRNTTYVLALSRDDAKKCHLAACGLDGHLRSLKDAGAKPDELPEPRVVTTELPD